MQDLSILKESLKGVNSVFSAVELGLEFLSLLRGEFVNCADYS